MSSSKKAAFQLGEIPLLEDLVAVASGGRNDAQQTVSSSCRGFIAEAPDVRVNYTAGSYPLIFSVRSNADTTLAPIILESESDDILVQEGYVAKSDRIGTKVDSPKERKPRNTSRE